MGTTGCRFDPCPLDCRVEKWYLATFIGSSSLVRIQSPLYNIRKIILKQIRNELPSLELLEEYLFYDETSSTFLRWKITKTDKRLHIVENSEVGVLNGSYMAIYIFNKKYALHRILWKLYYKVEPPNIIDHIDGNTKNNKISNLREATAQQNCLNVRLQKRNATGVIGVYWMKTKNKWKVEIKHSDGKLKYHGSYSNFEDAKEIANSIRIQEHGEWIRKSN